MRRSSLFLLMFACLLCLPASALAAGNLAAGRPCTASSTYPGWPTAYAVDADTLTTGWNAGSGGPAWIEIDLGADYPVGTLVGKEAMSPNGAISHTVTGRTAAGVTVSLGAFSGFVINKQLVIIPCNTAVAVRYVRITSSSPASWIAWWDLRVYAGELTVPAQTSSWGRIKSTFR